MRTNHSGRGDNHGGIATSQWKAQRARINNLPSSAEEDILEGAGFGSPALALNGSLPMEVE